ncbi:MAG: terminase gpA endonuclease subunit [Tabrizicola sp.]|uniref:phage terminase large subunit family protein n=1 Tax=Tabrizicola sp. TaxID=2005166 RepID=UPI003BB0E385
MRLPSTVAATAGKMRLFPYQRDIARSMGDPCVERVTWLKSARVGATQLAVAALGHYALNDPALTLVVMPSENDCRMLMTAIIEPTFDASPALRQALQKDIAKRDNMLFRQFPGGSLTLVSGASPKNLRARTARVLILDEVDALEVSAGEEGDPVALAIRRTMTFADRKIIMISTPVDESTSRIARAYAEGDQRVYEICCPACGDWHQITWASIEWPEGEPEKAHHVCPACGGVVEEQEKAELVAGGRWRATRPEVNGHHSYRSNALISTLPAAAWGLLAVEFLQSKRDPHLLKTFVNTVLGEVWRDDEGEGLDDASLTFVPASLDAFPADALYLTGGVDVQSGAAGRVELSTVAWDAEGRGTILAHEVLWGDPLGADLWIALSDLLSRRLPHPRGGTLAYDRVLIDSGDGNTVAAVYSFAKGRAPQVFPSKGVSGWRQPAVTLGRASDKTVRLQLLGVDGLKDRVHRMASAGTLTFSEGLPETYFDQLAGEEIRTRYSKGFAVKEWHQISGRRSEALDCAAMALAAKSLVHWQPDRRAAELASPAAPKKAPMVSRSKWLSGG